MEVFEPNMFKALFCKKPLHVACAFFYLDTVPACATEDIDDDVLNIAVPFLTQTETTIDEHVNKRGIIHSLKTY